MKSVRRKSSSLWVFGLGIFGVGALAGAGLSNSWRACRMASDLGRHLSFADGVKATNVGGIVLVEGEAETLTEYRQISEIVSAVQPIPETPGEVRVRNRVTLSERAKTIVTDLIERQIGAPEITVRPMGDTVLLEGTAENDFEADRAIELTRTALRFRPWSEAANEAETRLKNGREASSDSEKVRDLWPMKIVDMMRVRAQSGKKRHP